MRHRPHSHRTVAAAAALALWSTGAKSAGSDDDAPAAARPTAPGRSL